MFENKIFNQNCIEGMKEHIPDNSIDLIVTSPPYNVGIEYDSWNDCLDLTEYKRFMHEWLRQSFRVLKNDGRFVINIPYEVNMLERGGRVFLIAEYWKEMELCGFKFAGVVDLEEDQPQRVKLTAWGSWLSPSAPYIYNPKEGLILAYKSQWKKENSGISYFDETNKKEFQNLVYGQWKYHAETQGKTKANFSYDIPLNALKILTFENDMVLDPFMGSGTTAEACIRLNRKYIGFEISKNYCNVMRSRTDQTRILIR
jgi:site-specific DNA-methyltransferase (adenine-specific)